MKDFPHKSCTFLKLILFDFYIIFITYHLLVSTRLQYANINYFHVLHKFYKFYWTFKERCGHHAKPWGNSLQISPIKSNFQESTYATCFQQFIFFLRTHMVCMNSKLIYQNKNKKIFSSVLGPELLKNKINDMIPRFDSFIIVKMSQIAKFKQIEADIYSNLSFQ